MCQEPHTIESLSEADAGPAVAKGPEGFAGGVAALGGGAVAAHVLAFAAAPVISRLFPPEAFGTAEVITAVILVVGWVAALRYDAALMLPGDDADAANLLVVGLGACLGVTAAAAAVLWAVGEPLIDWLNVQAAEGYYRWAIPLGVVTFGAGLPLRAWTTRHRHFGRLGRLAVAETFTSMSTKIVAGLAGWVGPAALIFTGIAARAVPPAGLGAALAARDAKFVARSVSWGRMASLARRYVRFPLIDVWSGLLAKSTHFLPLLLLGAAFGPEVVGYFSRALLLVQLPLLLVGNAVGQVLFQRASAAQAAGEPLGDLTAGVTRRLIWISLGPLAAVAMIGPELFSFLLGERWAEAGVYAQLLVPGTFLAAVAMPLAPLLNVRERLGWALAYNVSLAGGMLAALLVGGWLWADARATVLLLSLVGAAVHLGLGVGLLRMVRASVFDAAGYVLRCVVWALPMYAGAVLTARWLTLPAWQVMAVTVAGWAVYMVLAMANDREARAVMCETLKRWTHRPSSNEKS